MALDLATVQPASNDTSVKVKKSKKSKEEKEARKAEKRKQQQDETQDIGGLYVTSCLSCVVALHNAR